MKRPSKLLLVIDRYYEYLCKVYCNGRYKVIRLKSGENGKWIEQENGNHLFYTSESTILYWKDIHLSWGGKYFAVKKVSEKDFFAELL